MEKAYFFDMDGTLFDSMPNHALAWERAMEAHGLSFPVADVYRNEGRTGQDVVEQTIFATFHRHATQEEMTSIYEDKARLFQQLGGAEPMPGVIPLLQYLHSQPHTQIWIVTGSGQKSLFNTLNTYFPSIFTPERMITAYEVTHGKPHPEPYLKAWKKSGLKKEQCFVIENAPLGIRSAKAAGLTCYAVNTGPLSDEDLWQEHADMVFPDMQHLHQFIIQS